MNFTPDERPCLLKTRVREGDGAQTAPAPQHMRLLTLDILRGLALGGMLLVHVIDRTVGNTAADALVRGAVTYFATNKFYTLFAILFGAGFALQMSRAAARREHAAWYYVRRLGALWVIGLVAEALTGYSILRLYALWGLPLLLLRNSRPRTLLLVAALSLPAVPVINLSLAAAAVRRGGEGAGEEALLRSLAPYRVARERVEHASAAASYSAVATVRTREALAQYARYTTYLPGQTLALFALGLLAVRLGIFHAPHRHRRRIAATCAAAVMITLLAHAAHSLVGTAAAGSLLRTTAYGVIASVLDPRWLALSYAGAVLLLAVHAPRALAKLAPLAWAGRMALTNYLVQITLVEALFAPFLGGVSLSHAGGLALVAFVLLAQLAASRWWLGRYQFGPAEWVWRSIATGRAQPMRVRDTTAAALHT